MVQIIRHYIAEMGKETKFILISLEKVFSIRHKWILKINLIN